MSELPVPAEAIEAVENLLKRHIPRYSYSRQLGGATRTDAVILAEGAIRALQFKVESRTAHEPYPNPINGGYDGYEGRCHKCDWVGPKYPPGAANKNLCRDDCEAHGWGDEQRLVSEWWPVDDPE